MTKQTTVFIFGIVLTLLPFLGIPSLWRQYLIVAVGLTLILVGYGLRRELFLSRIETGSGERATDSFVETTDTLFDTRVIE